MAKKSYYTGYQPPHEDKTGDYTAMLHRVADDIQSRYEEHAKTLRHIARHGVKEAHSNQIGPGHKKTNVALGG